MPTKPFQYALEPTARPEFGVGSADVRALAVEEVQRLLPNDFLPQLYTPSAVEDRAAPLSATYATTAEVEAVFSALADDQLALSLAVRTERPSWSVSGVPGAGLNATVLTADHASLQQAIKEAADAYVGSGRPVVTIDRRFTLNRSLVIDRSVRLVCRNGGDLRFTPSAFPQNNAIYARPRFLTLTGGADIQSFGDEQHPGPIPAVRIDKTLGASIPSWGTRALTIDGGVPPEIVAGTPLYVRFGRNPLDSVEAWVETVMHVESVGPTTVTLTEPLPDEPPVMTLEVLSTTSGTGAATATLTAPLTMQLKKHNSQGFEAGNPLVNRTVLTWSSGAVTEVTATADVGESALEVTVLSGTLAPGDTTTWGTEHWVAAMEEYVHAELDVDISYDGTGTMDNAVAAFASKVSGRVRVDQASRVLAGQGCEFEMEHVHLGRQLLGAGNGRVVDAQPARGFVERLTCDYLTSSLIDVEGPLASIHVHHGRAFLAPAPLGTISVVLAHNPESDRLRVDHLHLTGGTENGSGDPVWNLFASHPDADYATLGSHERISVGHAHLGCSIGQVWACYIGSLDIDDQIRGVRRSLDVVQRRELDWAPKGSASLEPRFYGVPRAMAFLVDADDTAAWASTLATDTTIRLSHPLATEVVSSNLDDLLPVGAVKLFRPSDGSASRQAYQMMSGDRYHDAVRLLLQPVSAWPVGARVRVWVEYLTSASLLAAEEADAKGWAKVCDPVRVVADRVVLQFNLAAMAAGQAYTTGTVNGSTVPHVTLNEAYVLERMTTDLGAVMSAGTASVRLQVNTAGSWLNLTGALMNLAAAADTTTRAATTTVDLAAGTKVRVQHTTDGSFAGPTAGTLTVVLRRAAAGALTF